MTRPAENARAAGIAGMSVVLLGGAAVLVAMAFLDWYDYANADSVGTIGFPDLRKGVDTLDLPAIVPAYFDWLAWVLLIGVIAVGMLANTPSRAALALRACGLVLGLVAVGLTYYALQEVKSYGDEGTYAFESADAGVWVALGGYLLAGIGAAIGPRRV